VANLPTGVSAQVRQSLADGTTYLHNLVNAQCQPLPSATAQANPVTESTTHNKTQRQQTAPPMQTELPPPPPPSTDRTDTTTSDQNSKGHVAKGGKGH
jgi:hypothetical protein